MYKRQTLQLTEKYENTIEALAQLVAALNAPPAPILPAAKPIAKPEGKLNAFACAQSLARLMPENSVISDDAVTSGLPHYIAPVSYTHLDVYKRQI